MSVAGAGVRLTAIPTRFAFRLGHDFGLLRLPVWRWQTIRGLETVTISDDNVPYRKQLKDEARLRRAAGETKKNALQKYGDAKDQKWELTVGIEVHAQLNTERKLFSRMEACDTYCTAVFLICS